MQCVDTEDCAHRTAEAKGSEGSTLGPAARRRRGVFVRSKLRQRVDRGAARISGSAHSAESIMRFVKEHCGRVVTSSSSAVRLFMDCSRCHV